jgi:hypothetical protein
VLVSRPGRFTPGTHWRGGWVVPKAGLNAVRREKFLVDTRKRTPAIQPIAISNTAVEPASLNNLRMWLIACESAQCSVPFLRS